MSSQLVIRTFMFADETDKILREVRLPVRHEIKRECDGD